MNLKSYLSLGAASVAVLASAGVANAASITIVEDTQFTITLGGVEVQANDLVVDANSDGVPDGPVVPNSSVITDVLFINAPGTPDQFQAAAPGTFATGFISDTNIPELAAGNPASVKSLDFNNVAIFDVAEPADFIFDPNVENTFDVSSALGNFIEIEDIDPSGDDNGIPDLAVVLDTISTIQQTPLDAPVGATFTPAVSGTGSIILEEDDGTIFTADVTIQGTFPTTGGDNTSRGGITLTVTSDPVLVEPVPEPASILGLLSVVGLAGLAKAKSKK